MRRIFIDVELWLGMGVSVNLLMGYRKSKEKAKQRCVMGVGICLYAQLVQTKNKQCKSVIILQCYHPHLSDFCSRPQLTQPYNHIIYPGVPKIYLVFF